jgi:hypothetical protein
MFLEKHSGGIGADNKFVPATLKTVRSFLQRQDGLEDKVHSAASIDPLRVAQANSKTRESMFVKLNNYIELLLHEMGVSFRSLLIQILRILNFLTWTKSQ